MFHIILHIIFPCWTSFSDFAFSESTCILINYLRISILYIAIFQQTAEVLGNLTDYWFFFSVQHSASSEWALLSHSFQWAYYFQFPTLFWTKFKRDKLPDFARYRSLLLKTNRFETLSSQTYVKASGYQFYIETSPYMHLHTFRRIAQC